jgi:hypothetical protein
MGRFSFNKVLKNVTLLLQSLNLPESFRYYDS